MQPEVRGCAMTGQERDIVTARRCRVRPTVRLPRLNQFQWWSDQEMRLPERTCAFCGAVYIYPTRQGRGADRLPNTCGALCSLALRQGLPVAVIPSERSEVA